MALKSLKKEKALQTEEDVSNESASDSEAEAPEGNAGWADSIAKVLSSTKPKTKKTLVLSRAKKLQAGVPSKGNKQDYDFEVEGEIKEEKPIKAELDEAKSRKNQTLALRMKPSWKDVERERALRKIATKGVVQLFNAVRIQQKDLQNQLEEAGPLDSRKEAVLNNINKRKFLDVLMSGKRSKSEAVDNAVKDEVKDESSSDEDDDGGKKKKSEWNVLRDDFMTNKKIKHWDEEDDEENSDNNGEAEDSDDDEEEDN